MDDTYYLVVVYRKGRVCCHDPTENLIVYATVKMFHQSLVGKSGVGL